MGKHRGEHRVQLRLIEVGLDHALLEVVEDDILDDPAEGPEPLLVQS